MRKIRQKPSTGAQKPSTDVTEIAREMRTHLETIAGSRKPGETVEAMLARLSYATGFNFSRVYCLWHKRAKAILTEESDRLRKLAEEQIERANEHARNREALAAVASSARVALGQRLGGIPEQALRGGAANGGGTGEAPLGQTLIGWGFRLGRARGDTEE